MPLTEFQRRVSRLLGDRRIAAGTSYVAGGAALNEIIHAPRVSRDLDIFHDTEQAVASGWDADRHALEDQGFSVKVLRERPSYVEAEVSRDRQVLRMEWARDSAFRFFPLVRHDDLGLMLHPFDLATNKVLALVGRLEVRDWVDVIYCDERIQPLGYLAWAASGKDPGFSPAAILEQAARTSRYSAVEIGALAFEGDAPDAANLSQRWRRLLDSARAVIAVLPPDHVGECVLTETGELFMGTSDTAFAAAGLGKLRYHAGRLHGALPRIVA